MHFNDNGMDPFAQAWINDLCSSIKIIADAGPGNLVCLRLQQLLYACLKYNASHLLMIIVKEITDGRWDYEKVVDLFTKEEMELVQHQAGTSAAPVFLAVAQYVEVATEEGGIPAHLVPYTT